MRNTRNRMYRGGEFAVKFCETSGWEFPSTAVGMVSPAICGTAAASFGFTGTAITNWTIGAVRLQQSCEQPPAARACDIA